jgi:hypothetical protein
MRSIAFFVFIFPITISLFLGTFVMAEVLKEPDRSLQMWNFKFAEDGEIFQSNELKIIGLLSKYSTSTPINLEVSIQDSTFDCGDLYITIFELISPKQVITQSGYFDQCFVRNNQLLPVNDKFSETIDDPGQYEILIEMKDKSSKKSVTASEKFIVN